MQQSTYSGPDWSCVIRRKPHHEKPDSWGEVTAIGRSPSKGAVTLEQGLVNPYEGPLGEGPTRRRARPVALKGQHVVHCGFRQIDGMSLQAFKSAPTPKTVRI
jgi:hypothetical protein